MDDLNREALTIFLGECWHECEFVDSCCKCGMWFPSNRPFTSPDDFFAVKNRLVELGLWVEFYMWAWDNWFETGPEWWSARFANWLIDPARFCQLAADFLKERKDADK